MTMKRSTIFLIMPITVMLALQTWAAVQLTNANVYASAPLPPPPQDQGLP